MPIYKLHRKRRRRGGPGSLLAVAMIMAVSVWWFYLRPSFSPDNETRLALAPQPVLTSDRPEIVPASPPRPGVAEKGAAPQPEKPAVAPADPQRAQALVSEGRRALEGGDLVAARTHFSEALKLRVDGPDATLIRAELTRLGNETIFSSRILPGDPLVGRYVIKAGDSLGKIAKANKISDDLLANINRIKNKNMIRIGQTIKVVKGPFHVTLDKSTYTLDVYLAGTLVKHFSVGLGVDDSTPTGTWRVSTKLLNPTYYPPRGGTIVAADDPKNPLGERWIGLQGVSGEARGLMRYGIHGTNEPDSVGQSVSMGCIRMYNEDVAALYTYLIEKHSIVVVRAAPPAHAGRIPFGDPAP